MKELIDRFNGMLESVSKLPEFPHVKHLDLRETLTGPNHKKLWANELHPTEKGFELVSAKFANVIATL